MSREGKVIFKEDGWLLSFSPFAWRSCYIRKNAKKDDRYWHITCEGCLTQVLQVCYKCKKKCPEGFLKKIDFFNNLLNY